MNGKRLKIILVGLMLALLAAGAAYAAANYGGREDPLITKSYLDRVLRPELEETLREELAAALEKSYGGEFTLLTLNGGQRVTGGVGTELLLRFGSASAYAYDSADTALVDVTDAAPRSTGAALSANHLYMITVAGNGFTAGPGGARVLISGDYTVE